MGLDTEKIKQRSQTNRMCSWLMKSIMKVEIEKDTLQCGEFDNAMRLFSESKQHENRKRTMCIPYNTLVWFCKAGEVVL